MTRVQRELFNQLAVARQRNIALYAEMARCVGIAEFKPRRPGDPDITLEIMKRAFEWSQSEGLAWLRQIVKNDHAVTDLVEMLIEGER